MEEMVRLLYLVVHTTVPQGYTRPSCVPPYLLVLGALWGSHIQTTTHSEAQRGAISPFHRGNIWISGYRVKSSSCLQRLKQSYLLMDYQKEWDDHKKTNLGLLFRRIIHLPLIARTIRTSISSVRVYVRSYACHYPLSYIWTLLVREHALIPW